MYIDENSLIINGLNMGDYVTQVEYGRNKVWGSDTGRNLKAIFSGTFLGVVPKMKLSFKPTTQAELELLAPILDKPLQSTQYYDPILKRMNTIETYSGDWATLNRNTFSNVARANEAFNISFIGTRPLEEE